MPDNEINPVIGIDLGTTFSAIARWTGREARIEQNAEGTDTTQSVVYHDGDDNYLVGRRAYGRTLQNPENGYIGVKRKMDDNTQKIKLGGKDHTPVEISSKILARVYGDVVARYPTGVFSSRGTVVTVPYYFKAHQCANTKAAADMVPGLNCSHILQEPIAASLSYALQLVRDNPDKEQNENMLVFDLGGGTFDLTIFNLKITKDKILFEVLGTGGDDRLGGLDFDKCFRDYVVEREKIDFTGLKDKQLKKAEANLMSNICDIKEALSASPKYDLSIPFLTPTLSLDITLERKEFEKSIETYLDKIKIILEDTFHASGIDKTKIDRVITVGGSSKIPIIKELLSESIDPTKVYSGPRPDLMIAEGAAIYAAYLDDPEFVGREIEVKTRTCHALGIEIAGGKFHKLIPENRLTPCKATQIFGTDKDDTTKLEVNVYQGSSKIAKENSLVGTVIVDGLVAKPKGELNIRITFDVSKEQMISVLIEEPVSSIKKVESLKLQG